MNTGFQIIEKEICRKISDELDRIGLLYRLFSRIKNEKSISEKIARKEKEGKLYSENGKLIQDIIGVRIVTYFKDDVSIVKEILSKKFKFLNEEIDEIELTVFKPKRTNIVCSLNQHAKEILNEVKRISENPNHKLIDSTFELQLRTILSEGWYEIDHSLRYKCKSDWDGHAENERLLNGIYATLETNDIALKNLFNELAYKHFKNSNWEALIRAKLRLNFQPLPLSENIKTIFNLNNNIPKQIIKMDREDIIKRIALSDFSFPITMSNLVFLINHIEVKDEALLTITPDLIKGTSQNKV